VLIRGIIVNNPDVLGSLVSRANKYVLTRRPKQSVLLVGSWIIYGRVFQAILLQKPDSRKC